MAGFFSPSVLEQVRAASDIVEVIGAVLPLKRAGANFVALCPFHKEKSPSFNVNPGKQIFHCFGCHKGGDVFTFVREYESLTFVEAVKRLAERAKIPLEVDESPGQQTNRFLKDSLLQLHEQLTQRWQTALTNDAAGETARTYLRKRGVSEEAVKLFRIGYAPEAWDDTVNWSKSRGYDPKLVEQAGLIIAREGGSGYYDRFRGRLMFPICDEQGRVIGFSGRVINGDEKTAKYVNSPETPIFTKGKVFFGLDKSKRALLDRQFAIICEGQLDLIACYMAGVQNIVAPQGTAFTPDHARILKRYVDEVVLCFDSDTAGQAAAVRIFDSLLASGLAVRVATLPKPHDPDSFIKEHGSSGFKDLIDKAPGFFDFYLNHLCETNDPRSDRGQLAITRAVAEAVNKTGSTVLQDKYAQKTAMRLGVKSEAVRNEFRKAARNARQPERYEPYDIPPEEEPVEMPRPSPQELWLLKIALLHDELMEWLAAHLDLNWIQHDHVREILGIRFHYVSSDKEFHVGELLAELGDSPAKTLVTELVAETRPIREPLQQAKDLVLRLRNESFDREIEKLYRVLANPELSNEAQINLIQQTQEFRAAKRRPLAPIDQSDVMD